MATHSRQITGALTGLLHLAWMIPATVVFSSCREMNMPDAGYNREFEAIASVAASDVTDKQIHQFFQKNKIACHVQCSNLTPIRYLVSVPKNAAGGASELLRTSDFRDKLQIYAEGDHVLIGNIPSSLVMAKQVYELFQKNNIECSVGGSRVDGIFVPKEAAVEATEILRTSEFSDQLIFYYLE